MTVEDARAEFIAALNRKTMILTSEIERMIVDQPFLLNPGVEKSSVNAVHFEYDWSTFLPVACPLNTATGYCGAGEPLQLLLNNEDSLFPAEVESAAIHSAPASEEDFIQETLDALMTELYVAWFSAGWKTARKAAPSVRGFLSVHDTIWRTDLDTGERFREDAGLVKFF